MEISLSNPIAALNIAELVLTIIICGLVGGLPCPSSTTEFQFVAAVTYGYLMLTCLIVASLFTTEKIDKLLRLAVAACGAVLWLASSALLLQSGDTGNCSLWSEGYDRSISGGVLGLANVIAFGVDAFFVFKSG